MMYKTIKKEIIVEQTIKKSKFITYLYPISNEEEAKEYLNLVRKQHHKANHHCSAYICGEIERSNDDGEPASSAGLPMLEVLRGWNMDYVIAIVVRYFGGIHLGIGGLIRAYGSSVSLALEAADLYSPLKIDKYELIFPYEYINELETYLPEISEIMDRDYGDSVHYFIKTSEKEKLDALSDLTRGDIKMLHQGSFIELIKEKKDHESS